MRSLKEIVVPQGIPSPATAGSSQQVFPGGNPLKTPPRDSSVQLQVLYYDTLIVLQYNALTCSGLVCSVLSLDKFLIKINY